MLRSRIHVLVGIDSTTRRVAPGTVALMQIPRSMRFPFHLTRELDAIGRFENVTDYAELISDFFGSFHDMREADAEIERALHKDPAIGYPAGQSLARQLRIDHTSNGIVYPSIRHIGGTCLVCFRPDLVQNLRQGGIWRLEWQGTATPSVTRQGQ